MARMGENIYKRKDGRWEGRCIIGHDENGRAFFRYLYGRSYKEVKEKLLIQDKQKQSNNSNLCSMYFGDILDNWLRRKKLSVKESSYGKYLHTVNHYIRTHLGSCNICSLTTAAFESYVEELLSCGGKNGQGLSPKTVQDILTIIKDVVSFGTTQEIPLPCKLDRLYVRQKAVEMRVFTPEEQRKLPSFLLHDTNEKQALHTALPLHRFAHTTCKLIVCPTFAAATPRHNVVSTSTRTNTASILHHIIMVVGINR
mgnify:CR=1 FL=1